MSLNIPPPCHTFLDHLIIKVEGVQVKVGWCHGRSFCQQQVRGDGLAGGWDGEGGRVERFGGLEY